jgi:hypothetical protein
MLPAKAAASSSYRIVANFTKEKRILIYWLRKCFSLSVPVGFFDLVTIFFVSRGMGSRLYRGIELVAFPPYRLDALTEVVDALELVRRTDQRRFARIERFIKRIVLANWKKHLGFYNTISQVCALKKLPIPEDSRILAIYNYSATLIHEATHAMLDKRRFPPTRANLKRIEKLCVKEEVRFLARFPGIDKKLELIIGYVDGLPARNKVKEVIKRSGRKGRGQS